MQGYPILLFRILASVPGGEELEDIGYEPFELGWHEFDQLGRVMVAITNRRDVEDIVAALTHEEEEDIEEARRPRPRMQHPPAPSRRPPHPLARRRR